MGLGIMAMHFIGMKAVHLPMAMMFDWPTVLLALACAILASALAFYIVTRPAVGFRNILFSGVFMGSGIAATHYLSMEAMRIAMTRTYSPGLVLLSILVAIVFSGAALQQAFYFREPPRIWRKFSSALLIDLAVVDMHYIGMAAMHFVLTSSVTDHDSVSIGSGIVTAMTLIIVGMIIIASMAGRRFSRQEQELADKSLQLQAIFDNMRDGIVLVDTHRNILR